MPLQESVDPLAGDHGHTKVCDLGRGAFGNVMLYKRRTMGRGQPCISEQQPGEELVAIKFIDRHRSAEHVTLVAREVRLHALLNHPHVIQFTNLGLTSDCRYVYMVMEYADCGDMFHYLNKRNRPLTEQEARWFFQQVILGLDYCHKLGIVNRDLKLDNLLLKTIPGTALPAIPGRVPEPRNLHVKVADFGLCKKPLESAPKSAVGTLYYTAPEVLTASAIRTYDERADVWSAAVILYIMLFRDYPFGEINLEAAANGNAGNPQQQAAVTSQYMQMLKRIANAAWRLPPGASVSSSCVQLLERMLVADPQQRFTVADIMRHPWFCEDLPKGVAEYNNQLVQKQVADQGRNAELGKLEQALAGLQAMQAGHAGAAGAVCTTRRVVGPKVGTPPPRR